MKPIRFASEKSGFISGILGGTSLLLLGILTKVLLGSPLSVTSVFVSLLLLALLGLFAWVWFGTYYVLEGNSLFYRSGPIHGHIDLQTINCIGSRERLWSGLKPALGSHGVVLYYNKWDEIYLSPKAKDEFISTLQQMNPSIEVVNNTATRKI